MGIYTFDLKTILTWGLDLSGSMQGAGGVGGLLFTEDLTTNTTWHHHYDGNGNVTHLTNASGQTVATYTYDAFGNTVTAAGTAAAANKYRFSTKPIDETIATTPLYYYGYRYYTPQTGRWINRDPIEEKGGLNLYGFVGNDGVSNIDYLGQLVGNDNGCRANCFSDKAKCYRKATRNYATATASCAAGGIILSFVVTPFGSAAAAAVCIAGATFVYKFELSDCDSDYDSCVRKCPCLLA